MAQVFAGGQLGNHAAVFRVESDLRGDEVSSDDTRVDDRHARLVTRTLDCQEQAVGRCSCPMPTRFSGG